MTTIQNLSNFFNAITLQEPDTVIVDEAAAYIWRLAEVREPHPDYEGLELPNYAEIGAIPDFRQRGVCTYTPAANAVFVFRGSEYRELDEAVYDDLHAFLADRVDPETVREFYIEVDQFNGFKASVPAQDYCETVDFAVFDQWINYQEAGVVEPADSEYSELIDDIIAGDEQSESDR